jgi:hypothetical protein
MYILQIYTHNARKNSGNALLIEQATGTIRKWTLLPSGSESKELLRLIALAACGAPFAPRLLRNVSSMFADQRLTLRIGYVIARHTPQDSRDNPQPIVGNVMCVDSNDGAIGIRNDSNDRLLPEQIARFRSPLGSGNSALFSLAFGSELHAHDGTDDFEFTSPNFRVTRYSSLFDSGALVTDPVRFLQRLHYRAIRSGRFPAKQSLESLCHSFDDYLDIDTGSWREKEWDAYGAWQTLSPWQQRAALPAIDAARHMMDAFSKSGTPLKMPGVMLFERPDRYCTAQHFPAWCTMMDRLFPNMQSIASLPPRAADSLPWSVRQRRLALPEPDKQLLLPPKRRSPLKPGSVLLVDVDSRLPNLALMKLSRHLKAEGRKVVLSKRDELLQGARTVYASCVFSMAPSIRRVERMRRFYGDSLVVGGSGVDLDRRLPPEIEQGEADYDLYPELGDRAMGFLTRGCPYRCPFCLVPKKEGDVRIVDDLDSLLQGRKNLILLDDNILAHRRAGELLEQMARRGLSVNFTQTLDLRILDAELTELLKRIHCSNTRFTRQVYHFSLNGISGLSRIRDNYARFGFKARDHVEFVCMYAFDTTLRQDVERFRFIESLPGAYVFVQEYQPILNGPPPPKIEFFDDRADQLIDELLTINFTQNMKSMERYYRWLSKGYALQYGRLHRGLVDTLFRYNRRDQKGRYIASLAGTRPLPSPPR